MPSGESVGGGRSRWDTVAAVVVLAVAAASRLAALPAALRAGVLEQWDGDSAYHLERIRHALADFPALPRLDPEMCWPAGAPSPWPDGFDLLAAAWARSLGMGDPGRTDLALALFTPALALLVVWATLALARRIVPPGPAHAGGVAAAGLLAGVAPALVPMSRVGFLDHHIAEVLGALLLATWAVARLRGPGGASPAAGWRWEAAGAGAAVFTIWVFAGGALYVALALPVVLAAVLLEPRPRLVGSGAPGLLVAAAASAALTLPSLQAHGRWLSFQFPSLLQPLLLACAAIALGLAVLAGRLRSGPWARLGLLALGGAAAAAAIAGLVPGAAREVHAALRGWLLGRDPWIATIVEFQRLGGRGRPPFVVDLYQSYGVAGILAPVLVVGGGLAAMTGARARGAAFLALSVALALLTANQIRFGRVLTPLLGVSLGASLAWAAARTRREGRGVALLPAAVAAVLVVADVPLRGSFSQLPVAAPPVAEVGRGLPRTAPGERDPGVLTPWDLGHLVSLLSGRPTLTNGFGPYLDPAAFEEVEGFFRTDAAALDALLERRRARFVVSGAMTGPALSAIPGRAPFVRTTDRTATVLDLGYMERLPLSPLVIGGSGIPGAGVAHLERLMPVFASREVVPQVSFPVPALWAYERVEGAVITGAAPAGAKVLATLEFEEQRRPHVWRAAAIAGEDGVFRLRVPLPSGFRRPTLGTAATWTLRIGDAPPVNVAVPEDAVRSGATVKVEVAPGPTGAHRPVTRNVTRPDPSDGSGR